jgi:hypothetical protein
MTGKFVQKISNTSHCGDQQTFGKPSYRYDYPIKALTQDDAYPIEACEPWIHYNMRLGNLAVDDTVAAENLIISGSVVSAPLLIGDVSLCTGKSSGAKSFDIPHVTQPGKRIRHVCAEGPEAGIYIRGRLTGKNVIDLPEYWEGLVDPETITVTLTQIKTSQDLIVDEVQWGKRVVVKSGNSSSIDCFYVIQASRIDGEPLIVEYEGETPAEYPGDDRQYSISGYDYDNRGEKSTKEMSDD